MKKVLAIALAMSMLLALTACGGGSSDSASSDKAGDDYKMQIPLTGIMCEAPTSIAYINKYFDDEGLNYETYKTDGTDNYDTMVSGKNDVIYGLLPTMVQRMANGFEMSVVMGIHHGCINMVASKASGIKSIDDLKGKTIGVPGLGSDPHVMLQRVLKAHDIGSTADNMEVTVKPFEDANLQAAMENGEIDAMISWDPFATQVAKTTDAVMIYNQGTDELTKDEYCCLVGLRKEFLADHPEAAVKYCKAIQKACEFIKNDPKAAAKLIIDNDLCGCDDVDLVAELLEGYNYEVNIEAGKASFQQCAQDFIDLGIIDISDSAEDFTNNAFATVEGFDAK